MKSEVHLIEYQEIQLEPIPTNGRGFAVSISGDQSEYNLFMDNHGRTFLQISHEEAWALTRSYSRSSDIPASVRSLWGLLEEEYTAEAGGKS
jgi:hypothetical protein